jgi:phenylpropionate dioxygenase-like ring-hydroxylating dioxygenase large terminal subunit
MLTREENDTLCKVGPGTLMGSLFREYQLPVLLSEDLESGGPPIRVKLLGEDLVAFRTLEGKVGLVGEFCSHRRVSLYFGQIEHDGIRCVYHGWKYGLTGQCLAMPNVPAEYQFKEKIAHPAYPCVEKGDIIWTYMGPAAEPPPVPDLEFLTVSPAQRFLRNRDYQHCNYFQALEGGIDPSHGAFLHGPLQRIALADEEANRPQSQLSADKGLSKAFRDAFNTGERTPRVEACETDYGVAMSGRRNIGEDAYLWRVNVFLFPFYTMPAGDPKDAFLGHMWVPADDENTVTWRPRWSPTRALTPSECEGFEFEHLPPSGETYGHIRLTASRANNYFMDWNVHKTKRFGIPTVHLEDVAVSESQGPIYDRSLENLTQADEPIVIVRRRLLEAAKNLRENRSPAPCARNPKVYGGVRGLSLQLPRSVNWADGFREHLLSNGSSGK